MIVKRLLDNGIRSAFETQNVRLSCQQETGFSQLLPTCELCTLYPVCHIAILNKLL